MCTLVLDFVLLLHSSFLQMISKTQSKWSNIGIRWNTVADRISLNERSLTFHPRCLALCKLPNSLAFISTSWYLILSFELNTRSIQSLRHGAPKVVLISYNSEMDCSAVVIVWQVFIFPAWFWLSESQMATMFKMLCLWSYAYLSHGFELVVDKELLSCKTMQVPVSHRLKTGGIFIIFPVYKK